ncbi:3'-5'-exoribonuclease [Thecaphora frezii]
MSAFDRRRINAPQSRPLLPPLGDASASQPNPSSQQRADGRSASHHRPIFLQAGLVPSASGSAYIETGNLKLACSVFGPRQVKGRQYAGKAELNVEVKFAPFSNKRRRRPGKTTESATLSALVSQALLPSLRLDLLPKASLDIHIFVLESDGPEESCVSAGTIAASTALASAGIEMFGLVVGTVALLPPSPKAPLLLDPTLTDLAHQSYKGATRILLCGMPALSSVTCLDVKGGAQVVDSPTGLQGERLQAALTTLKASLNDIHGVVAQALALDFEKRKAVLDEPTGQAST